MPPRRSARLPVAALALTAALLAGGCPPRDGPAKSTGPTSEAVSAALADSDSAQPKLEGQDPTAPLSRTALGSGLVIEELRLGDGEICWPSGTATLHIRGWSVATGKLYWDTYSLGEPRVARLRESLKGIREGVPGMRVGGKRRLTIPAHMAYGFSNVKGDTDEVLVPQGTPVVLEVELMSVQPVTLRDSTPPRAPDAPAAGNPADAPD